MAANKIKVKIIERDGEFFVDPPIAILGKDPAGGAGTDHDKLKIFNTTAEDLVFRIESAVPFGGGANIKLDVIRAGDSAIRQIVGTATDGQYPYQILMTKSGKKAKGNSDPVIIVDNP